MVVTGTTFMGRDPHVSHVAPGLFREGGSGPLRLRRLVERGFLYRVLRCLLCLRIARRLSRSRLICSPRCVSSAAHTTSPLASLTRASPLVLLPGSTLMRKGERIGCSTLRESLMVNG